MNLAHAVPFQNRLLCCLSEPDLALVIASAERVKLHLRQALEIAHQKIEFIYFLESGLGSVVAGKESGSAVEVGMFGRDGMSGTSLVQGDSESTFDCIVELEGYAIRIFAEDLENAMRQSTSLKNLMAHYAHALGIQTTYTALANAEIKLEQRLARWILMVDDRVDGHHFRITHEFIAMTLGVRRAGVTVALKLLEMRLLIKIQRREIFLLDRQRLIDLTKGTYGPAEIEYTRLIHKSPMA
ncbi:Crp/Fnr family transcriptional regulator [Rhizobium sp. VS19-DR104.2]|uniref:Crp/Fnr family transcriptional regulator n=1 Tax=unclassified Rhizobium TaxID=2613769 RepID=UPI001C5A91D5|nr:MULTISPECIES: Crp/Fnr family transcriptional regulator [unclassified Rhizobium]MBZ5763680.1 Crp/Fnr family transcriptional regulator [Rhizobium sp. VS19-DR96]MBZ5769604.1 Crp/Fnr family transcriptional regulator [Rhizobium sp. VS19-DR129.2]MBZ5777033.1 Crp/Fnr family transcriptional regulator [Rhizobium sp. VS19-DRK62.2]MBZ5788112.1 Crp/Fnr family transcriptional regulator [Rhizobium sp. VS19-DR121]MBZ5805732.1 Crp/Fnr family transcriptional regulator [Rhizobium sp. VS19-DR181]